MSKVSRTVSTTDGKISVILVMLMVMITRKAQRLGIHNQTDYFSITWENRP